jgi:hypothetical protein
VQCGPLVCPLAGGRGGRGGAGTCCSPSPIASRRVARRDQICPPAASWTFGTNIWSHFRSRHRSNQRALPSSVLVDAPSEGALSQLTLTLRRQSTYTQTYRHTQIQTHTPVDWLTAAHNHHHRASKTSTALHRTHRTHRTRHRIVPHPHQHQHPAFLSVSQPSLFFSLA